MKKFTDGSRRYPFSVPAHTMDEVKNMKEDEKKPVPWEMKDPKPPVIQSGHMENRVRNSQPGL